MYKLIISFGLLVTLAVPAFSDEYDSLAADWTYPQQMEQGTQPKFFAYLDRMSSGGGSEDRVARATQYDQSWVDSRYWCDSETKITSANNVAVFRDLPTGKNFFAIACLRGCENIKYSIASGSNNIVIFHSGLTEAFPQISVPGPTTYFHSVNIGFIFFDDGEGASPDRVQTRVGRPTLSGDTEIVLKHWRPHWMSSFMGKDCS
jgi:hypothetical protein